ncbi:hypothetical protein Pmar_PMAR017825 [Perkinsus marinus ATCC 50983]|uniref:Uncharacterized protein n=1 Tax=Perkinsus marinus (strain ATCC 50983 / TXsc) TaxID=423536 RepID=C5KPN8_PERM5|nr:hypothetical protein Pmar_PMAR007209 [Perkinsus marinus ATCC 50983]XP_002781762.1 hypothetical protein Pmar_PMAR017825 [Perkinsus marinus ATCC 50983]EEQ98828.1 hypothetical protein Pmar_PMAR007209 [Perkinsus marinus ATCC 50983]EER13557.1 hypothetical protein Pmar_PMAR017825 [Perkinsus marinus ATCC 50983]|eukprot:XP_002766111.1 hypothetical protein Pmar_PMAR007209 [Perkinsus marinus ATCC 50983]
MPFDPLSGLSVLGVAKAAVIPLKLACAGGASSGTHAVPVVAAATHLLEPSSLAVKASAMLGSKTGAAAATGTVAPQGQSIIDSGQDHPFWWRVTHEVR